MIGKVSASGRASFTTTVLASVASIETDRGARLYLVREQGAVRSAVADAVPTGNDILAVEHATFSRGTTVPRGDPGEA